MRLKKITTTIAATTLLLGGCSARQQLGNYMARSGPSTSASVAGDYDMDPPASPSNSRMAIQPSPVPPATGISQVRGISHSNLSAAPTAHNNACAPEACGETECVPGCTDRSGVSLRKPKCFDSVRNFCVDHFAKNKPCAEAPACADACTGDACTTDNCTDETCGRVRWYHRFMPRRSLCRKTDQCVEQDSCVDRNVCAEGCQQGRCNRGVLNNLWDKAQHNSICRINPHVGDYIRIYSGTVNGNCGYGYGACGGNSCGQDFYGSGHCDGGCDTQNHVREHAPLAKPMDHMPPAAPQTEEVDLPADPVEEVPNTVPPVPNIPGAMRQPAHPVDEFPNPFVDEQPQQPQQPPIATQAFVEPQIWPKLKAEAQPTQYADPSMPVSWQR